MRRLVNEFGSFFADKINRVMCIVIAIGAILISLNFYVIEELSAYKNETLEAIKKTEKKVDFRYFNLTNSLQDIHKVKIETYHGHIEK